MIRSIRGAITINNNDSKDILKNTEDLISTIIKNNNIDIDDIISIIFSCTDDIDAAYPAIAARNLSIIHASLLCTQEMKVKNSIRKCIRVLININSEKAQKDMKHVYLKGAKVLRPDLSKFSIAIDGPAGSGKSTIAKKVANIINYKYIDTGAMFRAIAYYIIENNIADKDIVSILSNISIDIKHIESEQRIFLNKKDVSKDIRTNEVSNKASSIAKIKEVREKLLILQRDIAKKNDVIMDGRDIGSFVLPNADLKIFLTASIDIRAERRYNELINKGISSEYKNIKNDIIIRDKQDTERKNAPLIKMPDAIEIDTSSLTIEEVIEEIIDLLPYKRNANNIS